MAEYAADLAKLNILNARVRALKATAPKFDAPVEAHHAYHAAQAALISEAADAGFKRIFDGSFKLNLALYSTEA